jgi:ParB-like nuclease domain
MPRKSAAAQQQPAPTSEVARPRAAAEWFPEAELTLWADNTKKATRAEIRGVARSIIRFGFGAPIVARLANREIIGGHTRIQAVRTLPKLWALAQPSERDKWHPDAVALAKLGADVPVRFLDLSEHDAHILALADNELGADNDPELLLKQLGELKDEERRLAGWTIDEYAKIYREGQQAQDDEEDELDAADARGARQLGGLKYQVVVTCENEDAQTALMERLELEGMACKPLVT